MSDFVDPGDDDGALPSQGKTHRPVPMQAEPEVEFVCATCGHSFRMLTRLLADPQVTLKCPACRKAFKMNQRFAHDAVDELDKRRRTDPIDRVWSDLGKILGD